MDDSSPTRRVSRPNLKVLFITGYAESAAVSMGFLDPGVAMITKPFALDMLMARIRTMIEEPSGSRHQSISVDRYWGFAPGCLTMQRNGSATP